MTSDPTSELGFDLYSLDEVDETRTVSGVALVAQDAYWRLKTPHAMGILQEDAPDYGFDLEGAIGAIDTPSEAAALPDRIRSELTSDERILSVDTEITRTGDGPAVTYDIAIHCETAEGPFDIIGTAGADGLELAIKLLPGGG
jgi:hypothetical protein